MMQTRQPDSSNALWIGVAMLAVAAIALGLHFGTNVRQKSSIRDEPLMKVPIDDIHEKGWSVETAIDYQEVKGPIFFWMYAIPAELFGNDINTMRLVSISYLVFGALPVLLLAGMAGVRGPPILFVAAFYMLLPYNLPQAQLLMSEASFIVLGAWAMWAAVWGMQDQRSRGRRVLALVVYGVLVSAMLHHRPHAVAIAGAVVLAATERDGIRSWPWWLASFLAGLSRIPLWHRWGGLVTSDYQQVFGFGIRPEAMTYFLAALVPHLILLIWVAWRSRTVRWGRTALFLGAGVGLVLGLFAAPDLANVMPHTAIDVDQLEFAGVVATIARTLPGGAGVEHAVIAALATLGGAAVAALLVVAQSAGAGSADGAIRRIAFWTIATGVPLYVITAGAVYDRYLVVWTVLLPVVWTKALPLWLRSLQAVALAAVCGYFVAKYLL